MTTDPQSLQALLNAALRREAKLRTALDQCKHAWADYLHNRDNIGWAIEELIRDAEDALSATGLDAPW